MTRKSLSGKSRWFLLFFALPFAGVGIFMGVLVARSLMAAQAMEAWMEVPAILEQVDLKEHRGDDSTTYRAYARYRYTVGGRTYTGERVGLHGGSDNIGSFQKRAYAELKAHQESGRAFRCFVNPDDPSDAILYRAVRWEMVAFHAIFVFVFGGVGLGLAAWSIFGRPSAPSPESAGPGGEPWRARADWASGVIRSGSRAAAAFLVFFAVVWNAIAWTLLALSYESLVRERGPALVVAIFPAVGLLLAGLAVQQVLRARRYGGALLTLATKPGVLGGRFAGAVTLPAAAADVDVFRVKLQCVQRERRGKNSQERLLWEDERQLAPENLPGGPEGVALPVLFAPPYDQPASGTATPGCEVFWRLLVKARRPGVDVDLAFDVPVYRTAESRPDFQLDEKPLERYLVESPPEERLRAEGIDLEWRGDVLHVRCPAGARKGQALGATVFAAIWAFVSFYILPRAGAPLFFVVVFGLSAVALVALVLDLWIGSSEVEADRTGLRWSSRRLLWTRARELPAGDVVDIVSERWGEANGQSMLRLRAIAADGRRHTLGRTIYDASAASTLATALKRALGKPVSVATALHAVESWPTG